MFFEPAEYVSEDFLRYLVQAHELGHCGFHGQDHWQRVLVTARMLAAETGANLKVVELFALIHDSRRENEGDDPEYGHRAARYAIELRNTWFDVTDVEMMLLTEAYQFHSDGLTVGDITVEVCWDADRLDQPGIETTPPDGPSTLRNCPVARFSTRRTQTLRPK